MHVAVVMPARNEEELIASSINSVPDVVDCLIVVDDSSVDSTAKIARNTLEKLTSSR
ncbi:MAG: glycosyltransferase [Candidatus Thermoplasmatota archaeon]|nr:glycosyltransferase [Candidatus Thermoplasmatota archaeon]